MTTFVLAILGQYVPLAVSYLPLGVLVAESKNMSTAIAFSCAVLVHIKQARNELILACCTCKSWRTPISTLASDSSSVLGVVHPYNF